MRGRPEVAEWARAELCARHPGPWPPGVGHLWARHPQICAGWPQTPPQPKTRAEQLAGRPLMARWPLSPLTAWWPLLLGWTLLEAPDRSVPPRSRFSRSADVIRRRSTPPAAGGGRLDSASPRDIAGALGKGEGLLGSLRPHAQAFLQMRVRPQASGAMPAGTGGRGGRRTCEAGPGRPMQERSVCPGPQPWGRQARPDPSAGLSPAEPLWARPSIPTLTRPATPRAAGG